MFPDQRRPVPITLPLLALALTACGAEAPERSDTPPNPLLRPALVDTTAPDTFHIVLETTKGPVAVRVVRAWAPLGADRFYSLVRAGYYDGVPFHRVMDGFVAEFGIHGDPYVNAVWRRELLADDPVEVPNTEGRIAFSKSGPNSRTTQVFINMGDNRSLDAEGFAPFGEVEEGMDVLRSLYSGYGDGPPRGEGVYQAMAIARGDAYFEEEFPDLDRIQQATVVEPAG